MAKTITHQLLEIHDECVAVRMTIEQAEQGELDGWWTCRGTVRVLSRAAALLESRESR